MFYQNCLLAFIKKKVHCAQGLRQTVLPVGCVRQQALKLYKHNFSISAVKVNFSAEIPSNKQRKSSAEKQREQWPL